MQNLQHKQIAFDLDTNLLSKYYPNSNWRNAYRDIEKFMNTNDFKSRQGSVYESTNKISYAKVDKLIDNLIKKYPWLNVCMRDCVVTNITYKYSLNHLFDKNANIPMRSTYKNTSDYPEKKHIQELRKNGFQPSKDILKKMQQLDALSGKYVDLKEIRDIYKNMHTEISSECKKLANEIGQTLKSQELERVTYR